MRVRPALPHDVPSIATVHVASWREAYAGILPQGLLDGLSTEARAAMWAATLASGDGPGATDLFVAERGDTIVGFGACGGQRDPELRAQGFAGEIGALYVLRACQRSGAGMALMRAMAAALLARGLTGAALWVLRDNGTARAFYERLGGIVVGEREAGSGPGDAEVAYGWRDFSPSR